MAANLTFFEVMEVLGSERVRYTRTLGHSIIPIPALFAFLEQGNA